MKDKKQDNHEQILAEICDWLTEEENVTTLRHLFERAHQASMAFVSQEQNVTVSGSFALTIARLASTIDEIIEIISARRQEENTERQAEELDA